MAKAAELANTGHTSTAIRIGFGDFYAVGSQTAAYQARIAFLEAVRALKPEVLDALRSLPAGKLPELCAWSNAYFHDAPVWITRRARATRWMWSHMPGTTGWGHAGAGDFSVLNEDQTLILIRDDWDPLSEQRLEAEARVMAKLAARMDEIQNQMLALLAEGRVKRATTKRGPDHFVRLARYQVNDEYPSEIAKSTLGPHKASIASVKEQLKDAAALIGLRLKPFPLEEKRGRPRKKS